MDCVRNYPGPGTRKVKPGVLFTIGRTTVARAIPVVRHSCAIRGYSRYLAYVRQAYAGRKFGRKSTTPTDMSYDLSKCDLTPRILILYRYLANFNLLLFISQHKHGSYVIICVTLRYIT